MKKSGTSARQVLSRRTAGRAIIGGIDTLVLGSNDYLGLSTDTQVLTAIAAELANYGTGIGIYPIQITTPLHDALATELSSYLGVEAVALFSSGSTANGGVLSTLVGQGDVIFQTMNHASIIDGCRLSRADVVAYANRDVASLRSVLEQSRQAQRRLIITDGIFSMEGGAAPLPEIYALAREFDALLVIDEAHATGVMGPGGTGTAPFLALGNNSPGILITGSLSKALGGASGGFVAGASDIISRLQAECRSFIFTQGMTTANAAAALAALKRIRSDKSIIQRLWSNLACLRTALSSEGVSYLPSDSAITAVIVGDEQRARDSASALSKAGVYAPAKTYPVVARGEARLRLQVSAAHLHGELEQAAKAIARTLA